MGKGNDMHQLLTRVFRKIQSIAKGDAPQQHYEKPEEYRGALLLLVEHITRMDDKLEDEKRKNLQMRNSRDEMLAEISSAVKRFDFNFSKGN